MGQGKSLSYVDEEGKSRLRNNELQRSSGESAFLRKTNI